VTAPAAHDGWTARAVRTEEYVDPGRVAALAALLDDGTPAPGEGDALPPLWHWVALPLWPSSSSLGVDGHPRRGDFLPPVDLPRRMFAGGEVTFHDDLRVGARLVREDVVESVQAKSGRSGPFVVVTVHSVLADDRGRPLVEERRDLVFRDAPDAGAAAADPRAAGRLAPSGPPLRGRDGGWDVVTDPTLLMRFSAVTANPHRIHYDWPYATTVEGYPGLVVQGPLSALLLLEAVRTALPENAVRSLRHRNLAALFCGDPARVAVTAGAGSAEATLRADEDRVCARLSAELVPLP